MRRLSVAAISAFAFAQVAAPAAAADITTKAEPPLAAPVSFQWAGGVYVGINGGYAFGRHHDVTDLETVNGQFSAIGTFGSLEPKGGFGGGQFGVNAWQYGGWVFGFEADFQAASISDSSAGTVVNFLPGLNATVTSTNKVEAFGTIRPRFGYAWDRLLIYATGGFAWGQIRHSFAFADNFNFRAQNSTSGMQAGYVIGGGLEYGFTRNLSAKAEYQYIDLGSEDYVAPLLFCGIAPCVTTAFVEHTSMRTNFHTVRLGLNWRWGN